MGERVFKVNESDSNKNCPDSGDSFGFFQSTKIGLMNLKS